MRDAVQRAVDQVQLIHDQTLRQIVHGRDARQAAEQVYMPLNLRGDWENYGQVESHVRQVYNGTIGWFGGDVYDIKPLSEGEEAARTVQMVGSRAAVQKAAAGANAQGELANWQWTLRLSSLLLELDPADAEARRLRAAAARALGQRTTSANARGFYLTEALQLEGELKVQGQPMTLDAIRRFVGTPTAEKLVAAPVDENLQFVRYLVDPRKAEGLRQSFTLAVEDDSRTWRVELRNGVIVISDAEAASPTHVKLTRQELAAFVLGKRSSSAGDALTELDRVLDRSHLMPAAARESVLAPKPGMKASDDLEHKSGSRCSMSKIAGRIPRAGAVMLFAIVPTSARPSCSRSSRTRRLPSGRSPSIPSRATTGRTGSGRCRSTPAHRNWCGSATSW